MNEIATTLPETPAESVPPLEAGDHLDQKTFHERYKAMPGNIRRVDRGDRLHAVAAESPPWPELSGINDLADPL